MILKPRKLEPGQTIGVIAPASPCKPERLERGISYLEGLGYNIKTGRFIHEVYGYLAGSDKDRAADVMSMFQTDEVDAIFCTRGGYGILRLLNFLDYEYIKETPKILVGYSDITALQLALFKKANLVTFSGPMVAAEMGRGIEDFTEKNFWDVITNANAEKCYTGLECLKPGTVKGRLLGGNLSMLCSLIGTPFLPEFDNAILFLEDVGEVPYRIDRKLMQLKLSGLLERVSAVIFGEFEGTASHKQEESLMLKQVFEDCFADLSIPVATDLCYGHNDIKYTIPQGVEAYLDAKKGFLELRESPVV